MNVFDVNIDDTESLLEATREAITVCSARISSCMEATRKLGADSRSIAHKTLEVLFSHPNQADIDNRRGEVVAQYGRVLNHYASTIYENIAALNLSWMNIDQGMGFLLLGMGRESDSDTAEVQRLIEAMKRLLNDIPAAREEIAYLASAIRGSAGGLDGLADDIAKSVDMLERLSGELDHGAAVLTRQIILAQRLVELLETARP